MVFFTSFNVNQEYEKEMNIVIHIISKKTQFYTISKKRFLSDTHLPALAEGIRNALLIDKIEDLKKNHLKY